MRVAGGGEILFTLDLFRGSTPRRGADRAVDAGTSPAWRPRRSR